MEEDVTERNARGEIVAGADDILNCNKTLDGEGSYSISIMI